MANRRTIVNKAWKIPAVKTPELWSKQTNYHDTICLLPEEFVDLQRNVPDVLEVRGAGENGRVLARMGRDLIKKAMGMFKYKATDEDVPIYVLPILSGSV